MKRVSNILVMHPPAQSDRAADGMAACFRAHSGYVAGIALRLLGRREDVDDVVQDVFLVAIGGVAKIREPEAVRAWLATVTARQVARRLRRRRLRTIFGLEGRDYQVALAVDATQEQSVLLTRIYQILDSLPVDQRIAWTLRKIEGEKLEAVALICGCSLATAKRRIVSAEEAIEKAVRDA